MALSAIERTHSITTEMVDGITVGTQVIPFTELFPWKPNGYVLELINSLNTPNNLSEETRRLVCFSLNNNTPRTEGNILLDRPVSSYFTYNPADETIIIEWGAINLNNGISKLHSYLNQVINYQERRNNGMRVSSGHIGKTKTGLFLALFDNLLVKEIIPQSSPMGKTINTLYASGFVPLTAEGFVKYPAF